MTSRGVIGAKAVDFLTPPAPSSSHHLSYWKNCTIFAAVSTRLTEGSWRRPLPTSDPPAWITARTHAAGCGIIQSLKREGCEAKEYATRLSARRTRASG